MIRHTIAVKGESALHHGELNCFLQGVQDGQVARVSQGDSLLYLIYRLSEKMGRKETDLSLKLMELNNIDEGECVVEQCRSTRLQHLKVKVSSLDWKIVNINQMKIAQSFLDQISIVWPGAALPIYYDSHNFVTLRPQCDQVGRLDVNTTVEFIQQEKKHSEKILSEVVESVDQQFESSLTLKNFCDFQEGYLNIVKVPKQILKGLTCSEEEEKIVWIVSNELQFAECPSIQELLDLQKHRQANSEKDQSFLTKKLVILQCDLSSEVLPSSFLCSKLCQKIIGISDKISISNAPASKPQFELISFELFLKDPNLYLTIQQILEDESLSSQEDFEQKSSRVLNYFVFKMMSELYQTGSFFVLQEFYPFCLRKELFLVGLNEKKGKEKNTKNYEIKMLDRGNLSKKDVFLDELMKGKVVFTSRRYPTSILTSLEQRYQEIGKWIKVVKQHFKEEHQQHMEQTQEDSIATLFKSIYQSQIDKILNFIQNTSQKCCLVTSFGSNGKTFMHNMLAREGQRMWKISFRDLSDPSLSLTNIQLYLHWIFASSPYPLIFIDDIEALCSKIEEGDQHRKKQKIISKLIARMIAKFSSSYEKRIIATTKSESGLDEEFKYDVLVTLKNPNRQQREQAMKELHVVVQPDDSPIHKVKSLHRAKKNTQQKVDQISTNTESLTLAAFSQHAINLTQPKTTVSAAVFNFSKLAGLKAVKEAVRSMIEKPIKYSFLFKSVPIKLPRGMLLYGGTGNGKTALGTALKDQFKMKYFSVKGSDILSKYIGGSEAAVRDVFEKALSVSPSIIFFDQFESIVPKRSANNTGVNDRIVNQFLCYLDGVSAISGVYIIAASSRPDLIDPAVLRPGRLDSHLFLDYPNPEERKELIQLFSDSIKIGIQESVVVETTEHFSYSDLIGLLKELRIKRSSEVLKMEGYCSEDFTHVGEQLFWETIKAMKLSVNAAEQEKQRKNYIAFGEGKAPDVKRQRQVQF